MSDAEYLEAQRKAFEAQFGSLESMGFEDKTKHIASSDEEEIQSGSGKDIADDSDDESEVSDGEIPNESEESGIPIVIGDGKDNTTRTTKPKVIKFDNIDNEANFIPISKKEQKMIRSGKTLKQINDKLLKQQDIKSKGHNKNDEEDEDVEQDNLKNDLELRRFLQESHLLNTFNQQNSGADLTLKTLDSVAYQDTEVMGKARMRTLESRLQNVSNLNRVKSNKLEKVPMNIRKGMIDKHRQRIQNYEQDARDGGIILSKVKKGEFRKIDATYKKDIERRIGTSIKANDIERNQRRQRGLKIQSVGRSTRNGLIISKDDIARVNNHGSDNRPKKFKKSGGKGKGKGKRR